jgi:hypothetical protein
MWPVLRISGMLPEPGDPGHGPRPAGSDAVARWALGRGLRFEPYPVGSWFHAWEPFDTMVGGTAYYNAVSAPLPTGGVTVAEPWLAPLDSEPLERTLYAFVSHPGLQRRAAARGGEHFNTRVSFLESLPPPRVALGDAAWDAAMLTFAASGSEAAAAFPAAARRLLESWGFAGHVEVRPGGLVLHFAGSRPVPADYQRLLDAARESVRAFVRN